MPTWGLALFFTTAIFFTPLVYIRNHELIDHHMNNAGNIINEQTQQVRDLASHHTNNAMEASSAAFKDYSSKAQEMMGQGKKSAVEQGVVDKQTADQVVGKPEQAGAGAGMPSMKSEDFPSAPNMEPNAPSASETMGSHSSEPVPQFAQ